MAIRAIYGGKSGSVFVSLSNGEHEFKGMVIDGVLHVEVPWNLTVASNRWEDIPTEPRRPPDWLTEGFASDNMAQGRHFDTEEWPPIKQYELAYEELKQQLMPAIMEAVAAAFFANPEKRNGIHDVVIVRPFGER